MHFERPNAFQNASNYTLFPEKKLMYVPTLPKFQTRYPKHIFLFALIQLFLHTDI